MDWTYKGKKFEPTEEDIKDYAGFVYVITDIENGMKYVGKKTLWSIQTRPPLKGKKRKRKIKKESDWRKYYGSSEEVKLLVENTGEWRFKREILHFCRTRGEMSYVEAFVQILTNALLKPDDYYNAFIGCKIHRRHVSKLQVKELEELALHIKDNMI